VNRLFCEILTLFLFCVYANVANAESFVLDDKGTKLSNEKPARRIISLAPHLTEMLFSAGAGQYIVGTVSYSDYPASAKSIKRIGSYDKFSLEQIITLRPDLIVAWESGNPHHIIEKLKSLGFVVFISEPRKLLDIPDSVQRLSLLTHTEPVIKVKQYLEKYNKLKTKYSSKKKVKLFYQFWNNPLMTINGEHLISNVMHLCGAKNIFGELTMLAPAVSVEAVVDSNVEVIIVGGLLEQHRQWLNGWKKWLQLPAVKNKQLYNINPDLLQRHTLRIIDGAETLCEKVDLAR